jgi:hypothetical protein
MTKAFRDAILTFAGLRIWKLDLSLNPESKLCQRCLICVRRKVKVFKLDQSIARPRSKHLYQCRQRSSFPVFPVPLDPIRTVKASTSRVVEIGPKQRKLQKVSFEILIESFCLSHGFYRHRMDPVPRFAQHRLPFKRG